MPDDEKDIDLVLVTGAGASRCFGAGSELMPLMADWSDALVTKLSRGGAGYLEATGLARQLPGPEFELRLGTFLREANAFSQIDRLLGPSTQFQALPPGVGQQNLEQWQQTTVHHLRAIRTMIHESLFELFGPDRIDSYAASEAYAELLNVIGLGTNDTMVLATTNYDVIGEGVLELLGRRPDWGEPPQAVRRGTEPQVQVDGLLDGLPRYTPVLHLHGRVGWYRRDDTPGVTSTGATRHQDGFGAPVVVLPDPEKVYEDVLVASMWREFEHALRRARRVLVLGHSLADAALVEVLSTSVSPAGRLAVSVLGDSQDPSEAAASATPTVDLVAERLSGAELLPIRFERTPLFDKDRWTRWATRTDELQAP
jgi:hypothetical protein